MKLKKIVNKILKEKDWQSLYKFEVKEKQTENLIKGNMNLNNWKIDLEIDPNIEEKLKETLPGYSPENLEDMLYTIISHQKGHWEYCPFDIKYGEEILSGISEGLKEKGVPKKKLQSKAFKLTTMFEDIVNNVILANEDVKKEKFRKGLSSIYLKDIVKGNVSEDYAAFIDTQMKLLGDRNLVREHLEDNYNIVNQLSEEAINILNDNLKDKRSWHGKAKEFAKLFADCVKEDSEDIPDNPFIKQMREDGEFRKQVIMHGLKSGHDTSYADKKEVLDSLYRERADEIVINYLKSQEEESSKTPITHLQNKKIEDGETFSLDEINWFATKIVPNKEDDEFWLYKKEVPVEVEGNSKPSKGNLSDICFITDSSASMKWYPKEGRGKYDILLRTIYSVFNYLERIGKGQHIYYSALNFAVRDGTEFSGWHNYFNLDKVKDILFNYQEGGETKLDIRKVRALYENAKDNFLTIMISDGEIDNRDDVAVEIGNLMKRGNDFVLIQIRGGKEFSSEIKKLGGDVHIVDKPEDIIGLTLEKTKNYWEV